MLGSKLRVLGSIHASEAQISVLRTYSTMFSVDEMLIFYRQMAFASSDFLFENVTRLSLPYSGNGPKQSVASVIALISMGNDVLRTSCVMEITGCETLISVLKGRQLTLSFLILDLPLQYIVSPWREHGFSSLQ